MIKQIHYDQNFLFTKNMKLKRTNFSSLSQHEFEGKTHKNLPFIGNFRSHSETNKYLNEYKTEPDLAYRSLLGSKIASMVKKKKADDASDEPLLLEDVKNLYRTLEQLEQQTDPIFQ